MMSYRQRTSQVVALPEEVFLLQVCLLMIVILKYKLNSTTPAGTDKWLQSQNTFFFKRLPLKHQILIGHTLRQS